VTIAFHQNGLKVLGNPSNLGAALGGGPFTCEFAAADGKIVRRAKNCVHDITDPLTLAQPPDVPVVIGILATNVS